jgi:sulfur-carrier protein adenylyltransferase/sulfurtransferase
MNNTFSPSELTRYSRQFALPDVGLAGQEKLKSAKVLCIGAGGLGSPVLLYLAAAGVGTLGIVDDDTVELSNLQRQILYTTNDLVREKATTAKERLLQLNPHVRIITHSMRLMHDNALEIIQDYDIVVDGTDNFYTHYLINDACFHLKKPLVYASIAQFEGHCSVFNVNGGPCYRCLYAAPPPEGLIPNCAEGGVFGVLPGLVGTLQTIEVIKLILNLGQSLVGRLLTINTLSMQFQEWPIQRDPHCRLCAQQQAFDTLPHHVPAACTPFNIPEITVSEFVALKERGVNYVLLDVREEYEYAICNLGGKLIPLSQLPQQLPFLDKTVLYIVHCKIGGRGSKAVKMMQEQGFSSVKNIRGGILAWIQEIDPQMAVY